MEESKNNDKTSQINHVRRKNRGEEGKSEDEAVGRFRLSDALDFGAEPEEERRPENEHDERCTRAGEIEERGGEDGENRGEEGDVGFEPAVKEENKEEPKEGAKDNAGEFNRVNRKAKDGNGEFLEGAVRQVDEVALKNIVGLERVRMGDGDHFGFRKALRSEQWQTEK